MGSVLSLCLYRVDVLPSMLSTLPVGKFVDEAFVGMDVVVGRWRQLSDVSEGFFYQRR